MRAIELASQIDQPEEEAHARLEVASVLHHLGDLEGSRHQASVMLEVLERYKDRGRLTQAYMAQTMVSFLEGDFSAARVQSDRGLEFTPAQPNLLGYRALTEYTLGDLGEGELYLDRLLGIMDASADRVLAQVIPLRTRITGMADRLEVAEDAAQRVISSPSGYPAESTGARRRAVEKFGPVRELCRSCRCVDAADRLVPLIGERRV